MYLFKLFFLPSSLFLYNNVYRKLGECWVCFCFALLPLWVEIFFDSAFLLFCNFSCDIYILYSIHSTKMGMGNYRGPFFSKWANSSGHFLRVNSCGHFWWWKTTWDGRMLMKSEEWADIIYGQTLTVFPNIRPAGIWFYSISFKGHSI